MAIRCASELIWITRAFPLIKAGRSSWTSRKCPRWLVAKLRSIPSLLRLPPGYMPPALLIRTCISSVWLKRISAPFFTSAISERSMGINTIFSFSASDWMSCSAFGIFRTSRNTRSNCGSRARRVSHPMPEVLPVRTRFMAFLEYYNTPRYLVFRKLENLFLRTALEAIFFLFLTCCLY